MCKKALILGITGQIGQYICEYLLAHKYNVYGVSRHLKDYCSHIITYQIDMNNHQAMSDLIIEIRPDEIYHLASPTNINDTILDPIKTYQTNINSLTSLCETIKSLTPYSPKLFTANSSEIFRGNITNDHTSFTFNEHCDKFYPISPYGISKLSAYWLIRYYRETYHLPFWTGFFCNVISPKLKPTYLIPKIITHVKYHVDDVLNIGNIDLEKDFAHASDMANGIMMVMNTPSDVPVGDYVISSGQSYSLRTLIEYVYQERKIPIRWEGTRGFHAETARLLIVSDETLCRKYEKSGEKIIGDNTKLRNLGWIPQYNIVSTIHEMYENFT